MNAFTQGEKVVLKTSPIIRVMTVLKANDNGSYVCQFENEKHKEETANFFPTVLERYSNPATIILF